MGLTQTRKASRLRSDGQHRTAHTMERRRPRWLGPEYADPEVLRTRGEAAQWGEGMPASVRLAELRELAQLLRQGVIDAQEFEARRRQTLGL